MYICIAISSGEVQEWLNWLPWKGSVPVRVPWVRIPPSPQIVKCKQAQTDILRFSAIQGEVSEWLKEPVSKTGIVERLSRVRIPPSPHDLPSRTPSISLFDSPYPILYFFIIFIPSRNNHTMCCVHIRGTIILY